MKSKSENICKDVKETEVSYSGTSTEEVLKDLRGTGKYLYIN